MMKFDDKRVPALSSNDVLVEPNSNRGLPGKEWVKLKQIYLFESG